jgi:hypothetical protein
MATNTSFKKTLPLIFFALFFIMFGIAVCLVFKKCYPSSVEHFYYKDNDYHTKWLNERVEEINRTIESYKEKNGITGKSKLTREQSEYLFQLDTHLRKAQNEQKPSRPRPSLGAMPAKPKPSAGSRR